MFTALESDMSCVNVVCLLLILCWQDLWFLGRISSLKKKKKNCNTPVRRCCSETVAIHCRGGLLSNHRCRSNFTMHAPPSRHKLDSPLQTLPPAADQLERAIIPPYDGIAQPRQQVIRVLAMVHPYTAKSPMKLRA